MTTKKLISVAQAAQILELSDVRVRQLCQQGRIGEKVGRNYVLDRDEVTQFAKKDRPHGRPPENF